MADLSDEALIGVSDRAFDTNTFDGLFFLMYR